MSPVALGAFILLVSPTFFRPLITGPAGVAILVFIVVFVVLTNVLVQVGLSQGSKGHVVRGSVLMGLSVLMGTTAFLLIFLGPLLAILLVPTHS
jgi:hypothetical protein